MAWFKKKPDPIAERAEDLDEKIAALEAEIRKLSEQEAEVTEVTEAPSVAPPVVQPVNQSVAVAPAPAAAPAPEPAAAPVQPQSQPRLRSTALPRGLQIPAATTPPAPIFEEVDQQRLHETPQNGEPVPELGTRKFDVTASWRRLKSHFRGPATSNPKLVSYLAAGSIQGLRPLRYEKRVARNRFVFLVIVLALVLWGVIWVIVKNR
jgi:hypothetical protein